MKIIFFPYECEWHFIDRKSKYYGCTSHSKFFLWGLIKYFFTPKRRKDYM